MPQQALQKGEEFTNGQDGTMVTIQCALNNLFAFFLHGPWAASATSPMLILR